jgi:hypothetical protein
VSLLHPSDGVARINSPDRANSFTPNAKYGDGASILLLFVRTRKNASTRGNVENEGGRNGSTNNITIPSIHIRHIYALIVCMDR